MVVLRHSLLKINAQQQNAWWFWQKLGKQIRQALDFVENDKALQGSESQFWVCQAAKIRLTFQVKSVCGLFPRLLKLPSERCFARLPCPQYRDHGKLLEQAGQPVAVEDESWGGVKSLFR